MYGRLPRSVALRCFVAASAGNCVATATTWMQPMLIRYLVLSKGLNEAVAGLLLTVEMGAIAVSSMAQARWIPRQHSQKAALLGTTFAIAASFATLHVNSYPALFILRALVGLGCGVTVMVNNIVAANSPDPEKLYGRMGCVNLLFGSLIVWAFDGLTKLDATATPFTILALGLLVLLPFVALLPKFSEFDHAAGLGTAGHRAAGHSSIGKFTILLAVVNFAIVVCSGMAWSLYGLIGERAHLSTEFVDAAITASIITGFVGMGLPAILGSSIGRIGPFTISLFLMAGAILVLTSSPSPMAFRVAVCINVAAIYFILPYISGAAIAVDGSGRSAAYLASVFFVGTAVSPFIGGSLLSGLGLGFIGKLVVVVSIPVALIYAYVVRAQSARPAMALTSK